MSNLISLNEKIFLAGSNGMAGKAISRSLKKKSYGDIKKGGLLLTPSSNELNL